MPATADANPAGLPGPPGLPLFGHMLQLHPARFHQTLEDWAAVYGPYCAFRIGTRPMVSVTDPEAVVTLLRERPEKFTRNEPMQEIFLEMGIPGVFPVEGEQWQRQRRIWMQAMNVHRVRPFFVRLTEMTERLRQRWIRAAERGARVDVIDDLMRYTVDVTTLFAFGHDGNTLGGDEDVVQRHLKHVFPAINRRLQSPFPYWRLLPMPADFRLKTALRALRRFTQARIDESRARLQSKPALRDEPGNLLEALLAASENGEDRLSDEEIHANTLGALLAGEDTTAYTLAWMIHELMAHPDALAALRAEADAVLGERPVWDELDRAAELQQAAAVMSETLRLRPVAPINGMTALQDVELGGHEFPAGTHFIVPLRALALDPAVFADPRSYRPERWLQGAQGRFAQKPPHPFGGGKRTCPGMNLAQQEIKSVITMLVRNFEFRPAGGPVRERLAFTMYPQNLHMRLRTRDAATRHPG